MALFTFYNGLSLGKLQLEHFYYIKVENASPADYEDYSKLEGVMIFKGVTAKGNPIFTPFNAEDSSGVDTDSYMTDDLYDDLPKNSKVDIIWEMVPVTSKGG